MALEVEEVGALACLVPSRRYRFLSLGKLAGSQGMRSVGLGNEVQSLFGVPVICYDVPFIPSGKSVRMVRYWIIYRHFVLVGVGLRK